MGLRRRPIRALLVPDDETWLFSGCDLRARYEPTLEPGRASVLVAAETLPEALGDALRATWEDMPVRRRLESIAAPFTGPDVESLLNASHDDGNHEHGGTSDGHAHGEGHGHAHGEDHGHAHHDMMAITGEPSADGLVMEHLDAEAGPLGVALPTGLVVSAALDGDVVSRCEVRATLRSTHAVPDPAAPAAWEIAAATAEEQASGIGSAASLTWLRIARLESERALSHLTWLHRFLRLLGWFSTAEGVRRVVTALLRARATLPTSPEDHPPSESVVNLLAIASNCAAVAAMLESSRSFALRTGGLGRLTERDVRVRGLLGPTAWASGVSADLRSGELLYSALGFEPVEREEGDARARALIRADDAWQSILLLSRAVQHLNDPLPSGHPAPFVTAEGAEVEGPRGHVAATRARDGVHHTFRGEHEAARAAGDLAVGREWGAALVVVASFDLSPWSVEA
jgi:hypothetical protein